MTPEQIALSILIKMFEKVATGSVAAIVIFLVVGPWLFSFVISWINARQLGEFRRMYENNVELVKAQQKTENDLIATIDMSTSKWTEAIEKINTNQFCPSNRTEKVRMETVR